MNTSTSTDSSNNSTESFCLKIQHRHVVFGWWSLTGFVSLGIFLEAMHAFKIFWYLDPGFEIRRLLWRLAHAHGTLLSLVQLGFAFSIRFGWSGNCHGLATTSILFLLAGLLLPLGFFLGGIKFYGGDPGLGIFLAPVGAACMLVACLLTAWSITKGTSTP
ncbi:MAG: hypothetical protein AAGA30_08680 [Planctomycetota bacterium]